MIIMFYLILFSLSFSFNDLSLQEGLTTSELSLLNKNAESNSFKNFREPIILDNSINPNEYIIGPGDEFDFNMISSDGSITISLLVSPTGDVLIPNIGNINVDGMILDEAINKIIKICKGKYSSAEIFINLVNIRRFNIQVFGPGLEKNGYLTVSPIDRLSYVYRSIQDVSDLKYSIRDVEIIRDAQTFKYDLLNYFVAGQEASNPYLNQNDKVRLKIVDETISISGAINIQQDLEFHIDDSLYDIIQLSGGFTQNADSNYIEITRFVSDDKYIKIVCDNFEKDKTRSISPYDNIRVRSKKDFKETDYIYIHGEINFPGYYLLSDIDSYKKLIELAGGYTNDADVNQIQINNEELSDITDLELNRILLIPPMDRTPSEISYLKARKKINKGSIISNDSNFTLNIMEFAPEPNDIIFIPRSFKYIEVIGAVIHPGRYEYDKELSPLDYINLSGGKNSNSTKNIFVIKAADSQRIPIKNKKSMQLDPGDIIFIEEKEDYNNFNRFKETLQILGNISTILVVLQTLSD